MVLPLPGVGVVLPLPGEGVVLPLPGVGVVLPLPGVHRHAMKANILKITANPQTLVIYAKDIVHK